MVYGTKPGIWPAGSLDGFVSAREVELRDRERSEMIVSQSIFEITIVLVAYGESIIDFPLRTSNVLDLHTILNHADSRH